MSLKSVRAEKGRLQGEDLLSERIEGFERGGGQVGDVDEVGEIHLLGLMS